MYIMRYPAGPGRGGEVHATPWRLFLILKRGLADVYQRMDRRWLVRDRAEFDLRMIARAKLAFSNGALRFWFKALRVSDCAIKRLIGK